MRPTVFRARLPRRLRSNPLARPILPSSAGCPRLWPARHTLPTTFPQLWKSKVLYDLFWGTCSLQLSDRIERPTQGPLSSLRFSGYHKRHRGEEESFPFLIGIGLLELQVTIHVVKHLRNKLFGVGICRDLALRFDNWRMWRDNKNCAQKPRE